MALVIIVGIGCVKDVLMSPIQIVGQNRAAVEGVAVGLSSSQLARVTLVRGVDYSEGEVRKDDFKDVCIKGVGVERITGEDIEGIEVDYLVHIFDFIKGGISFSDESNSVDCILEVLNWS